LEAGSQGQNCEIGGGPPEAKADDGIRRQKALRASEAVLLDESTKEGALTLGGARFVAALRARGGVSEVRSASFVRSRKRCVEEASLRHALRRHPPTAFAKGLKLEGRRQNVLSIGAGPAAKRSGAGGWLVFGPRTSVLRGERPSARASSGERVLVLNVGCRGR
jgi:hypothetical protein